MPTMKSVSRQLLQGWKFSFSISKGAVVKMVLYLWHFRWLRGKEICKYDQFYSGAYLLLRVKGITMVKVISCRRKFRLQRGKGNRRNETFYTRCKFSIGIKKKAVTPPSMRNFYKWEKESVTIVISYGCKFRFRWGMTNSECHNSCNGANSFVRIERMDNCIVATILQRIHLPF